MKSHTLRVIIGLGLLILGLGYWPVATPTIQAQPFDSYLDPYKLNKVTLAGSHNTFEKKGEFEYLYHAFDYVYLMEIDVWAYANKWFVMHGEVNNPLKWPTHNDNNCPKSGRPGAPRNQDLRSCIEGLRYWHDQNPNHPLVIVKLELKSGFVEPNDPVDLDNLISDLRNNGRGARIPKEWIFKPADLMCKNPPWCTDNYATPEDAAQADNWPTMAQLRGKFMFILVPGTASDSAPAEYVDALRSGVSQVAFPSVFIKGDEDSRVGYYRNAEKQKWNVIFGLQAGRLDTGEIPISRTDWMAANNFLILVDDAYPWQNLGQPGPGFERLRMLSTRYKANVISTDQEKLCRRFIKIRDTDLWPVCQ
ncbi:MAG: hypothetical protein DCC55_13025 [Chloroflexi bacterium]|nr:MAG: hypothetical protein DCC55_13025 [Chloroflexota bacterium]